MKNVELIRFESPEALAQSAARRWFDMVEAAAKNQTNLNVALSGGRIAGVFFAAVVEEARRRAASLAHVEFYWSDERCVPPTDAASNFLLARQNLLEPLDIQPNAIHRLRGELPPAAAVEAAADDLLGTVKRQADGFPVLDLVLLGLGEDGHVASLFPGEAEADVSNPAWFRSVIAAKPPPARLTMGYRLIAAASEVWVLASGQGKAEALAESLRTDGRTPCARLLRLRTATAILTDIGTLPSEND